MLSIRQWNQMAHKIYLRHVVVYIYRANKTVVVAEKLEASVFLGWLR